MSARLSWRRDRAFCRTCRPSTGAIHLRSRRRCPASGPPRPRDGLGDHSCGWPFQPGHLRALSARSSRRGARSRRRFCEASPSAPAMRLLCSLTATFRTCRSLVRAPANKPRLPRSSGPQAQNRAHHRRSSALPRPRSCRCSRISAVAGRTRSRRRISRRNRLIDRRRNPGCAHPKKCRAVESLLRSGASDSWLIQ